MEWQRRVQDWVSGHTAEMVGDVIRLVRVRSVAGSAGNHESPYGADCAEALRLALSLCGEYGFPTENLQGHGGVAWLGGKGDAGLGIFTHLDVVAEGENWSFAPYEAFERDGYIAGRGSQDNKGAAVAAIHLLRCLREMDFCPKQPLMVYFGCDEESGMRDIPHFLKQKKAPAFSLVPDVRFPLCHGEKGILHAVLARDISGSNLLDFSGGVSDNSVPDFARALLSGVSLEKVLPLLPPDQGVEAFPAPDGVEITARGVAGHAAFPEGTVSAIHRLADFLSRHYLTSSPADGALQFLTGAFADYYGEGLGIACADALSGRTTHMGSMARLENGRLTLHIDVRCAVTADIDSVAGLIRKRCGEAGFLTESLRVNPGYYSPPDSPEACVLTDAFRKVYPNAHLQPYVMGGGTYARKLPRALGFGPGMPVKNPPFAGGHQPDEGVEIRWLQKMIEAYAIAIPRLYGLI